MKQSLIIITMAIILHKNGLIAMYQSHEKKLSRQHEIAAQMDADKYALEALKLAKKQGTIVQPFSKNVNLNISKNVMAEIIRYNSSKK